MFSTIRFRIWYLAVLIVLAVTSVGHTQTGGCDSRSLDGFNLDSARYQCGDEVAIFAASGSSTILILDIEIGVWSEIDLGIPQTYNDTAAARAGGSVALAWSDNLLFGYSAELHTWDTISYVGEPLENGHHQNLRSFGCCPNLAYFVTHTDIHIFDGHTAEWLVHSFSPPGDLLNGVYRNTYDDYFAMNLLFDSSNQQDDYLYSQHTQSFCELLGLHAPDLSPLDHGIVGYDILNDEENACRLIGWSAFDNSLSTVDLTFADPINDEFFGRWAGGYLWHMGENTARSFVHRQEPVPDSTVRITHFGYDTYHGSWESDQAEYELTERDRYAGSYRGGRFGVYFTRDTAYADINVHIFNGLSNEFHDFSTGMNGHEGIDAAFGGSGFMFHDSSMGWGYDAVQNRYATTNHHLLGPVYRIAGANWAGVWEREASTDNFCMSVYNADRNEWLSIPYSNGSGTSFFTYRSCHFLHLLQDYDGIFFYSAYTQNYLIAPFPLASLSGFNDYIHSALFASPGYSIFWDERTGIAHELDFEVQDIGLGSDIGLFFNSADSILHAYNAVTESWDTLHIDARPDTVLVDGGTGVVCASVDGRPNARLYIYNVQADDWTEVVSNSAVAICELGERCALILDSNIVYGYSPYNDPTGVNDINIDALPDVFAVTQNYPNPFNPSTEIEFTLPRRGHVRMVIYNSLGQQVRELVNEDCPVGTHRVHWDGNTAGGARAATGVYFYRITYGDQILTKKMLLLK